MKYYYIYNYENSRVKLVYLTTNISHFTGEYNFAAIQKAFALVSNLEKTSFPKDVSFGEFQAKSDSINFILKVLQKDYLDASAYVISTYWSDDTIISALTKGKYIAKVTFFGSLNLPSILRYNNILYLPLSVAKGWSFSINFELKYMKKSSWLNELNISRRLR